MSKTRHTEQTLTAKGHTHIIPGTLYFCPARNKQVVTIKTRGVDGSFDGNTREIATSDLHQTFWTKEVKRILDLEKRSIQRAMNTQIVILEDADFEALAA